MAANRPRIGTVFEVSNSDMTMDELEGLVSKAKSIKKALREESRGNFDLAIFTDLEKGYAKFVTQARANSKYAKEAEKSLQDYSLKIGMGDSFSTRKAPVSAYSRVVEDKRQAAAVKAMDVDRNGAAVRYNDKTKAAHVLYETSDFDTVGRKFTGHATWSVDQIRKNKELEQANVVGTAQWKKGIHGRMDKRVAVYNEKLNWARQWKNRHNPIAKAIRRSHRNKTFGGRALNKATSLAKKAGITLAVAAISTAIGTAVKFLSRLPDIARDVLKIAGQNSMLNLTPEIVAEYKGLAKVLFGKEDVDIVKGYHGWVHSTAGDVVNNNIEGAFGKLAAVLSLGGGTAITAMAGYLSKNPNYTTDKVSRAVTNDIMRATFGGQAIGYSGGDMNVAHSANMAALKAENPEAAYFVNALYRRWEQIEGSERDAILDCVVNQHADFTEEMMRYLDTPDALKDTGAVAYERSGEVANKGYSIFAQIGSSLEGILRNILAAVEPILEWLRHMYYGLLEGLNESVLFKGRFDVQIGEYYRQNRQDNAIAERSVKQQKAFALWKLNETREKLGIKESPDEMHSTGGWMLNLSPQETVDALSALGLLRHLEAKEAELRKQKTAAKPRRVADVTPVADNFAALGYAQGRMHANSVVLEKLVGVYENKGAEGLRELIADRQRTAHNYENRPFKFTTHTGYNWRDPITDEANPSFDQYIASTKEIVALAQKILDIDTHTVAAGKNPRMNTGYYTGGDAKYDNAVLVEKGSEKQLLQSKLIEGLDNVKYSPAFIGSKLVENLWESLSSGDIKVRVNITEGQRDWYFHLIDDRQGSPTRGKEVGSIHQTTNPFTTGIADSNVLDVQSITTSTSKPFP